MKIVNILFNFIILELFCQICHVLNFHEDHKVLLINNKEILPEENLNFDIEPFQNQLNKSIDEISVLKKLIENEINIINNNYDKIYNEVTQFFKENKKEKEENIIDKLQFEVTKIKEKLEYFLTDCNAYINFSEKINKIIKPFKNEKGNNIFKRLIYISKINDNVNKIDKLKAELMQSMNINFIKEKPDIILEKYYFNGIPTPNQIEFQDINSHSFKLFWNLDYINIINIDLKYLKSIVKLKRNSNGKFNQVYEGINKNCIISNLNKNTNYELKIRFKYNDIVGPWSEIHKIKTSDIIYKIPINPKTIKIKSDGIEYVLISHRYHESDKFSSDKTRLSIHRRYFDSDRTPVKWLFIPDEKNLVTIKFDIESYGMMNWEVYSDENNILLCKYLTSKFEIIMINEKQFYIRDVKSGKYFWNSKRQRDIDSLFIELKNFDDNEKERFLFYV